MKNNVSNRSEGVTGFLKEESQCFRYGSVQVGFEIDVDSKLSEYHTSEHTNRCKQIVSSYCLNDMVENGISVGRVLFMSQKSCENNTLSNKPDHVSNCKKCYCIESDFNRRNRFRIKTN